MKLFGSNTSKITKDETGENMLHLEITEVILFHCNIINNDYQKDSRYLYKFINYQIFHPRRLYFQKCLTKNFHVLQVLFTDQNSKPPEIEDQIN